MAKVALILAILLANRVKGVQEDITLFSSQTQLPSDGAATVFAFQIQQIRSTPETTPAASSGNNLNTVRTALNAERVLPQNFLPAASTIYLQRNKKVKNENEDASTGVTTNSLPSKESKRHSNKASLNVNDAKEVNKPLPLVLDECIETTYVDNYKENALNKNIHRTTHKVNSEIGVTTSQSEYGNKGGTILSISNQKMLLNKHSNEEIKTDERKQYKQDINVSRKETNTTVSTLPTIPITSEFFDGPNENFNLSLHLNATENIRKAGYTESAWFETKDKSKIRFSKLPQRESYLIPTLKLGEGFYPFRFMSEFFTLIYPFDYPVELIKDVVWGEFTFPYSFLKSIKVESTFLAVTIMFACIAFVIPAYLICLVFLTLVAKKNDPTDMETGALFPVYEDSECNGKVSLALITFMLLLCAACIGGMEVSNEQATASVLLSRTALRYICADIANWLASAARELILSLVPPVDLVIETYRDDLRNVEGLLGQPVLKAMASESGIDLVLDSLNDIVIESEKISSKISVLRDVSIRAGSLATMASDKLRDLSRQLDNMKKHCIGKDVPLCDTINVHSLEMLIKFDVVLHEKQLYELRYLGVEKLTEAVSSARRNFLTLPSVIFTQTSVIRTDILKHMESRREIIHRSSRVLSDIVRHLTASLFTTARWFETGLNRFQNYDFWRWIIMLGCIVICGFVILLILCAVMCGCTSAKIHSKRTLQVSTVWLCLTSLCLWTLLTTTFLIAGHAEVYVCHTLKDSPQYHTLSGLLDRPSPLLNKDGIFDVIFRDVENVTIDISVKDVLRECERDRPAYNVFQLDRVFDVNKVTSYFEWDELQNDLRKLADVVDVGHLKTLSSEISDVLHQILQISDVNFARYRLEYNGPIVGKDLPSLVDQLENIAAQAADLTTSGRLDTLASRTRRLYLTSIKPLEQLRAEIVYKLTELELQISPFRRKLNISLSHIHTAQYYIDNQGDVIVQKKVSLYTGRLVSHVASWRTHVLTVTSTEAARCGPVFTAFNAARSLLCTRYVASLHGWWFCGFLLAILWCLTTPLTVSLWRRHGRRVVVNAISLSNMGSGQQETPTTLCDTSNWNIPCPPPPNNDGW